MSSISFFFMLNRHWSKALSKYASTLNEMRCAILYNLKYVKNIHGGLLLLVKSTSLKVTLLHGCPSLLLNCRNSTKSPNVPQIFDEVLMRKQYVSKCFFGKKMDIIIGHTTWQEGSLFVGDP